MKTPGQIWFEQVNKNYCGDAGVWNEFGPARKAAWERLANACLSELGGRLILWHPVSERPSKKGHYLIAMPTYPGNPRPWVTESWYDPAEYPPDGWSHIGVTQWSESVAHPEALA